MESAYKYLIILGICIVLFIVVAVLQKLRGRNVINFDYAEELEEKYSKEDE